MGATDTLGRVARLAGALLGVLLALSATAHPYHTSFAEIDWSASRDRLEVSVRVLPEDLETALSWRNGRPIVLGRGENDGTLVADYLREHFQVSGPGGRPLPLQFVGMELHYAETWLYFTVTAVPSDTLRLSNTLLLELDNTQTNRVRPLWGSPEDTLVLNRAQSAALLWKGAANTAGEL